MHTKKGMKGSQHLLRVLRGGREEPGLARARRGPNQAAESFRTPPRAAGAGGPEAPRPLHRM